MVTKGVPAKHPIGDNGDHMTASGVFRLDSKEPSFTNKKKGDQGTTFFAVVGDNGYQGGAREAPHRRQWLPRVCFPPIAE